MTRLGFASALFAVLSVGAACDNEDSGTVGGPVVVHRGQWNGDDGLARGSLTLDGNCLYFTPTSLRPAPIGEMKLILAFAQGAVWDDESRSVHYDGLVLGLGPDAKVGGGLIAEENLPGWVNRPDPSCQWDGIWYVADAGVRP